MKRCILFLVFILLTSLVFSQNHSKKYMTVRVNEPPVIDGVLNDEAWKKVSSITDFHQREPIFNNAPSQKTEVWVVYDDNAIYVGACIHESDPDSIFCLAGSRDDQSIVSDKFYIGFDTYNTLDAYVFGLTASGVQMDYKDSDPTFDAVWQSKVKIDANGWNIEMKIPYSAIRFPSISEQEWGFQVIRTITRNQEYIQWALTERTLANSRTQWGRIGGLKDIKPPLRLSVTPFANYFYNSEPVTNIDNSTGYQNSNSYNFGADLKIGINEKYTMDLTLLPDFSQTQSDNKVKNLSYTEVVFNENRPFFKEGTELFEKDVLFYSRRIGQTPSGYHYLPYIIGEGEKIKKNPSVTKLLNAIKLSGRNNNGLGIGVFNAITDNMYAIVEDTDGKDRKILTEPLTNYNVVVFDQALKNNSSVYLINTNVLRDKKYNDANVTGSGFTFMDKKNKWATDGSIAISQQYMADTTEENYYGNQLGTKYFIGARKASGNLQFGVSHSLVGKTFDPGDMGYQVIGNKQKERLYVLYNTYIPKKYFRESYNSFTFDYLLNPETTKSVFSQVNYDLTLVLKNYYSLSVGAIANPFDAFDYYEPRIAGFYSRVYKKYSAYTNIGSDSRKSLYINFNISYGNYLEEYSGGNLNFGVYALYRINNKFQVVANCGYSNDNYDIGFANVDSLGSIIYGGRNLRVYENILSAKYVIKNDMSISIRGRHYWNSGDYKDYYTLLADGDIILNNDYNEINNYNYNVFNIDFVYSWQFAPGSTISIVYKNAIETEGQIIESSWSKNFSNTLDSPQINSLSIKILYYIDYAMINKK